MSKSHLRTFTVPWRRVCAVLPSIALIGGGIVFSAAAAPAPSIPGMAVSKSSPAVVVPDTALSMPAPAGVSTDASRLAAEVAPPPVLAGTVPSSSLVNPDSSAIPVRALEGYRRAASLVESADHGCHIDWALVAAIGRVESNHARFGGNQLDSAGIAQPGIIGIPLDGSNGTARIPDSDGGLLDRDTVYDRAVGPMQFIPSTWRVAGVDANGDGVKNPQDIADAATATAVYLCSGPGDLTRPNDLHSAIMRYNASESYVTMVTDIAATYRLGVSALPAADLAPANAVASTSIFTTSAAQPANSVSVKAPSASGSAPTTATGTTTPVAGEPSSISPTSAAPGVTVPPVPDPTVTVPPVPDPTVTVPPVPDPTVTVPPVPDPTVTAPPVPDPTVTVTVPPEPCVTITDPVLPAPANPCPTPTATATP